MGDVGGLGGENGVVLEENGGVVRMGMIRVGSGSNPDPDEVDLVCLEAAEEAAKEVLCCIHPTLDSEERRKDVIDYVQKLFRDYLGCEIFPYGSVPLKTYLPDGDIDLTAIHTPHVDDYLPREVLAILQEEELNENAEYQVRDTQFIDAEVKLVKCLVQNIVVDISFNQLGGLSTLCFLEQVDRLAGKDHLFKRSILLIKSWCYYESRILGAHHGLISTYALETLVLYIFHLFHSSLTGPLAVLYRFLDFYGKFDWDKYCISLDGPVRKSTLPDIVVENSEYGDNDQMLSKEFLRYCMEMFSVPSSDQTPKAFPTKHLNIIDPLKENNNLGRSVHRGNYYRIRSAFKHGARKLGQILSLPRETVADEIRSFFANTLERHGCKYGDFIHKPVLAFEADWSVNLSCSSSDDTLFEDDTLLRSSIFDFEDDAIGVEEKCTSVLSNELNNSSVLSSQEVSSATATFSETPIGDGNDESCSRSQSVEEVSHLRLHAPELCQFSSTENGPLKYASSCQTDFADGTNSEAYESSIDELADICSKGSEISSPKTDILGKLCLDLKLRDFATLVSDVEPLNSSADLSGDYDSHLRSFLYGQSFDGLPLSARGVSYSPLSPSRFRSENTWDTVCQSSHLRWNHNSNFLYTCSSLDVDASCTTSRVPFSNRYKCKARGTGTYIPNTNSRHKERSFQADKERTKSPENCCQLQRNSSNISQPEMSFSGNGTCEEPDSQSSVLGKSLGAESHVADSSRSCVLQFGSWGSLPVPLLNNSPKNCSNCSLSQQMKSSKPVHGEKCERVEKQSFHLKNDDFPALAV
ncbi:hypothetical protein LIER_01875 [Lithospermum erythrorhizon]|uniref:Uncharacterized protein n=1 Tax=Lithospermum erythrorhizon TaxID=34254 RepID=A0AAV3NMZ1_LITER